MKLRALPFDFARYSKTLIHANGHHMAVTVEPLMIAVARILEKSYGPVTSLRRLTPSAWS